ncbi:MAG: DnaJ domain-containing protein [Candidatus Binatia bacterium]
MAGPDFYKTLGVPSAASAQEIKSAHRELVKKHHPDLYTASSAKQRATERLREINEAYATLGNAQRRQEYDQARAQNAPRPKRPTINRAARNRTSTPKTSTKPSRPVSKARKKFTLRWKFPVRVKLAGGIAAGIIVAFFTHAVTYEPRVATAWALLEKIVVEPSQNISDAKPDGRWNHSNNYGSRAECTAGLKERVQRDEREGSKVIFDESVGTVAITVYVKDVAGLAREYANAKMRQRFPDAAEKDPAQQQLQKQELMKEAEEFVRKSGMTKRVSNYECRSIQVVQPEPWLRRQLRRVGLISG